MPQTWPLRFACRYGLIDDLNETGRGVIGTPDMARAVDAMLAAQMSSIARHEDERASRPEAAPHG